MCRDEPVFGKAACRTKLSEVFFINFRRMNYIQLIHNLSPICSAGWGLAIALTQ